MIKYHKQDLFEAIQDSSKNILIPHVCNNFGLWGKGFVVPLGEKFPLAKQTYLNWHKERFDMQRNMPFRLGETQIVKVASPTSGPSIQGNIYVANMVAQHGVKNAENPHPLKYSSLYSCMESVAKAIKGYTELRYLSIHAPKFGSGLAGGDWSLIERVIKELWLSNCDEINIYYL